MILNKSLLLKCLGGVAACFGTAGVGILGSQSGLWNNQSPEEEPEDSTELGTLIAKVGLTTCTSTDGTNNECTIGSSFNVKQESNSEENKTKDTSNGASTGKIKVYSENTYSKNFKFVIEEGDISLTGDGTQITKLEQFETYEIKEESGKWYFSRRKKAADGIKKALGLPSDCTLGDTVDCTDKEISSTNISSLKFDGLNSGQNPSIQGTAKLTVTKETPSDDFPFGYKFTFKGKETNATITINNNAITLDTTNGTEFRIKKPATGNNITLEEVGTLEELLGKVGLTTCNVSGTTECGIGTDGIKVKQESNSEENKKKSTSSGSSTGKIKVYTESGTPTYNKGFKFVIEEGDIELTEGSGSGTVSKLEQFETYEIKEDGSGSDKKWYLTRKTKAADGIKKALGLPDSCTLPENTDGNNGNSCNSLSSDDLKNINFDGKTQGQEITFSGTASLTITKLTSTDSGYPFGYKFSIQPTQKLTISSASPENSIPANMNIEFKIKKTSGTNQISLEKAWTLQTLAAKVGLENCNDNSKECSIKDGSLNIKHDETKEDSKTKDSTISSQGKIKVYKDTSGYKEGFKFVIEDGDISFTSSNGNTITKLEQFETYEIEEAEESGTKKYYLSRKTKAFKEISKALGLPTGCDEIDSSNQASCSKLDKSKLKGINFEGKGSNEEVTIEEEAGSNINLKVSKTTDTTIFPHGYKFVLESDKKITIPQPSGSTPLELKKNTNTEFKIKVTTAADGSKTLSLEKAWTAKSLGEKVGLTCVESGTKECTLNDGSINVKNDDNNKIDGAKVKEEGSSKKITYQEDQEGYNQGIKFTVEGGTDIELTKDGSDGSSTLNIENSSTSYEIKEHAENSQTKWYLTKHTPASQ